ncbi:MAG: alpha/beta hydrolase [Ignavibacteriae bacterium HGW-Ignavibacteriae-4]|jgi:pimeloyl-ACP methyl ester carboxylesterase|nr:MAG: alpha/beta hydrolase [Ignavibacteriae bacterium HGW-Ignavibacteriae-4]
MQIKSKSYFKDQPADINYFEDWVTKLEKNNGRKYERYEIQTSLGKTHVWGLNTKEDNLETLVIFPGARTTALIWDFDKGLENFNHKMRIFMVETNGLPNLSDGETPDIKSLDYGHWANEVFEKLEIDKAFIAGASFGGLICMKFGIVNPEKIKAAFLLNPGCLQPFSMTLSNLYFNLLPIISPTENNVSKFLDKAVFSKSNHSLSEFSEKMLVDYEVFAISRYKDNTQKPYYMNEQLSEVKVDTYLLEGDKDLLFPFQKSINNAKLHLKNLKAVEVFENVGHGIETYDKALNYIGDKIKEIAKS